MFVPHRTVSPTSMEHGAWSEEVSSLRAGYPLGGSTLFPYNRYRPPNRKSFANFQDFRETGESCHEGCIAISVCFATARANESTVSTGSREMSRTVRNWAAFALQRSGRM